MYNRDNIFPSAYTPNLYEHNNYPNDCFCSPTPFPNYNNNGGEYWQKPNIIFDQENEDKFNNEIIAESLQPKDTSMNKLYEIGNTDISKIIKTKDTSKDLMDEREENKITFEEAKGLLRKKAGRKKKEEKCKGDHNKYSKDNIIRKIKTKFSFFISNLLNESLFDKNYKFLRLDTNISKCLKKDYNLSLFNTKIKDLFLNSKISRKYRRKIFDNNQNIFLINKIFAEGKETQVISILNLTYIELFNIFRKSIADISDELKMKIKDIYILDKPEFSDINKVFNEIYEKELNNDEVEEDIDEYISQFKLLCIGFEKWFVSKNGRNRTKNN